MCTYVCTYVFTFKASCGNATQDNSNIIICNGINDCADGSDEIDCCKNIITYTVCVYKRTYGTAQFKLDKNSRVIFYMHYTKLT